MTHDASTDVPIHSVLTTRWSPYSFDPDRDVGAEDLRALFEAARWSMSSFNAQPWRYIVGSRSRTPEVHAQVLDALVAANQGWAQYAPVLALGITVLQFEHNGTDNHWAAHDLGAASANLTFEATHRGIQVHQMAGIDADRAADTFGLEDGLRPVTALAIGYAGANPQLDESIAARESRPRERKSADDLIIAGSL